MVAKALNSLAIVEVNCKDLVSKVHNIAIKVLNGKFTNMQPIVLVVLTTASISDDVVAIVEDIKFSAPT